MHPDFLIDIVKAKHVSLSERFANEGLLYSRPFKLAACFPTLTLCSSVARGGQEGAAAPPIIARDEFCNSPKSVEKLKGGGGG